MMKARFGQTVKIKDNAPYFRGSLARVAYVGDGGVSVYLCDSDFDECLPLKDSEYDVLEAPTP